MGTSYALGSALDLLFLPYPAALSSIAAVVIVLLSVLWLNPGGFAWALFSAGRSIPGPPGMVLALSSNAAHRTLAKLADAFRATDLMAFSVGFTAFVVSSHPDTAREILNNSAFADRPVKESAYELLFHRAMGFAPFGEYWRNLRRISATYMFSPARIADLGDHRRQIGRQMVSDVTSCMAANGVVEVKKVLHFASLNNVMMSVFGKRFDFGKHEGRELEELVIEGYELLGAFNWSDHFPLLRWMDPQGIRRRCRNLVARVNVFVGSIIEEHRRRRNSVGAAAVASGGVSDFVDVLLDLEQEEKLSESDMVAVLWEMIFRGTDTVAILLEWVMARMVLHPGAQSKAQAEIDEVVGDSRGVSDADISSLPYLQAIVKETLRLHPPGPLLSWARLAVHDAYVGDHLVPAGTTAMVNMWAIARDGRIWQNPDSFQPERFTEETVNVLGSDLRLAPFGAGRRVCPGKALALSTVHLWAAQLLQSFEWVATTDGVDLSECLKMSLEMKNPLICRAFPRI